MASLRWTWADFWGWYEQLETESERIEALKELIKDGWLEKLSVENQVIVMSPAPLYVLKQMILSPQTFKTETILKIQYNLNRGIKRRIR